MALFGFVESHLDTSAQFRKDHDFQILVFKVNGIPFLVNLFIQNLFNHRVWVNNTAASLINTFFQKHRIFFRFPDPIGWNHHFFVPGLYLRLCLIFWYSCFQFFCIIYNYKRLILKPCVKAVVIFELN